MYVGFVSPHFPLIAPPEFYDLYPEDKVPWPDMYEERPSHPFTDAMRKCMCFDESFDAPMVRRAITAYMGLVTFLDDIARAQAKQADAEIAAGKYRGPLHGIPWGAKDIISVKGHKTTWGSAPFKDQAGK